MSKGEQRRWVEQKRRRPLDRVGIEGSGQECSDTMKRGTSVLNDCYIDCVPQSTIIYTSVKD